jgi:hypothetical protein
VDPTTQKPVYDSAPTEDTGIVPASAPRVFNSAAVKLDFSSDGISCQVPTTVKLVINDDGTSELSTTGPNIIDHFNCEASGDETWYINGTDDDVSQTVGFQTCNFGNFPAAGLLTYANQTLLGTVSCINKDGTTAITLNVGP